MITQQPTNQTVNAGGNATLSVTVSGTGPFTYQWRKNSLILTNSGTVSGATSNTLTLTGVKPWDAGIYTVTVSNAYGNVVSFCTALRVFSPSGVVAWGYNSVGQTTVPSDLTNAVAIAGGAVHSLALKSDGTVVGWGDDNYGEINVPTDLTNAVAIAAGYRHSLALKSDGTMVGWGENDYGVTSVPTGLTNLVSIAAGWFHTLVLKSDGTVAVWGDNSYGQTNVPSGLTNVVGIAAGFYHNLALKGDGTVVAWGWNFAYGQTNVPTGLTNVVGVAGGNTQSLALKGNGTVVGWGDDVFGEINVPTGLTNAMAIAAGGVFGLALKGDGTVVGWGDNSAGETHVPSGLTNVVAIAAGQLHSLALGNLPPVITQQPTNQTVNAGGNATLSVTVSGTGPFTYQWRKNSLILTNSGSVSGATSNTLTLTGVKPWDAGIYTVTVSNTYGSVVSACVRVEGFQSIRRCGLGLQQCRPDDCSI